ncbi:MAG: ABC transporter permease [Chloroflexi bacterium]|nr:ABC transporter permease [Chloroflexota bacterium]
MNPLSIFLYYARNKRKALPLLGILVLAVFGISLSLVLTGTMFDSIRAFISPFHKLVIVEPNYNKRFAQIDPAVRAEIYRNGHIAQWLPEQTIYTYGLSLGNRSAIPIFAVNEDAMPAVLAATQVRVGAGRLPTDRADEVMLHSTVAKSRGLWVGSQIGRDADSDDNLAGKWTIVGISEGDTVLNLAPLTRATKGRPATGLLLIPRAGEMDALVAELDAIANEKVVMETPAYWNRFISQFLNQVDSILTFVNVVIVFVLSLGVGLLNVIYFRQRVGEFGILRGIGYSRLFLARRVALESLTITVLAWIVGMVLSAIVYQVLNVLIFEPQGATLSLFNMRALSGTLPVPIFVWLFSTATVAWQLRRLDPVAVIDRRD